METHVNAPEPQPRGLGWYLQVLRRRKWLLILPIVVGIPISIAFALNQTAIYRSTAKILIEDPEIPRELVSSTVTTYAEKRLQVITQRVMATDKLLDVMRRFDLYVQERERLPVSVVADTMRDNVNMDIVNAQVVNPQSGQRQQVTVAFTLSFDHPQPEMAQRVTNELVSLYLNQNIIERRQQATETTNFLRAEAQRIGREIAQLETELAELKKENVGSLPDQLDTNRRSYERTEGELRELTRRAQALQERKIYLESELAQLKPQGGDENGNAPTTGQRLESARTELATAIARYTPDHPDVKRLERTVRALEQEVEGPPGSGSLHEERDWLQGELASARERYGEEHPDVKRLTRELAGIESALARTDGSPPDNRNGASGDPAAIQLRAQLLAADSELRGIAEEREQLKAKLENLRQRLLRTPLIERDYTRIVRELEGATAARQQVAAKLAQAELAEALETERKGERFSLVEPPQLPEMPFKPDRRVIVLVGFVLSVFGGIGAMTLFEALDDTVREAEEVRLLTGEPPLVVVPHLRTSGETARLWGIRGAAIVVLLAFVAGGFAYVHTQVRPLDILVLQLQQRANAALDQSLERLR